MPEKKPKSTPPIKPALYMAYVCLDSIDRVDHFSMVLSPDSKKPRLAKFLEEARKVKSNSRFLSDDDDPFRALWSSVRDCFNSDDEVKHRFRKSNSYPAQIGPYVAASYFDIVLERAVRRLDTLFFDTEPPQTLDGSVQNEVYPFSIQDLVERESVIGRCITEIIESENNLVKGDSPDRLSLELVWHCFKEYQRAANNTQAELEDGMIVPYPVTATKWSLFPCDRKVLGWKEMGMTDAEIQQRSASRQAFKQSKYRIRNAGLWPED